MAWNYKTVVKMGFGKRLKKNTNSFFSKDFASLSRYEIGEYTYGRPEIFDWNEGATLRIGKFCSIADNVKIFLGGNHRVDWNSTYPFNRIFESTENIAGHPSTKGDVILGNDVWLGHGVTILSGITIGDGACVGAMSVVSKDVPPYAIIAGNPFKIIRYRFSDDKIQYLMALKWWDWPISKILAHADFLQSTKDVLEQ